MHGGSIAPGPFGFIKEGNIGLRNLGVDIFQSDIHGAHGNAKFFKAGEEVEQVVGGQCEFGGFGIL